MLILLAYLTSTTTTFAQSKTDSRDGMIVEIQSYAARHVDTDSPMQTQLIVDLYRSNMAGLSPREIAQIYESEYSRLKKLKKPNAWETLRPGAGWIVAIILTVLLVLRDLLKDWVATIAKSASAAAYRTVAGNKWFWAAALKRYRAALIKKYHKLHIPFRPNRPLIMKDIYVPLRVAEHAHSVEVDLFQEIADHHRLMVIGTPGSGKSTLLKHIALSYAGGTASGPHYILKIPVLIELYRLNDPEKTLKAQIAEELARNDFPHAERFIKSILDKELLLLLDGLDEVSSSERRRVAQQLKDFFVTHPDCRAVLTCRSAIYEDEFAFIVEQTLELLEFSDNQIRLFLDSWEPDMRQYGKSVEQLMHTLNDRPLIKALARNPLLLTIISYLYTDTEFVLPQSRAEFYRKASDVLLDIWHHEHNQFKGAEKRLVLQHLALFIQDKVGRDKQDRLSVDRIDLLKQLAEVLPSLNLRPEHAVPLLDEIIERSGLVLSIDGGARYQFSHLTLQEYYAAAELFDDMQGLITRFTADPDTWREVVKLWCGLDHDSSDLISALFKLQPISAFECLSDVQKLDPPLGKTVLCYFKDRFDTLCGDDNVVRAFGIVASNARPRGIEAFEFLKALLADSSHVPRMLAAANALSVTNQLNAAKALSLHYKDAYEIRKALVSMGDVAIDELSGLVQTGLVEAVDDLACIRAPRAIETLVECLQHADQELAGRAAWHLANLLQLPEIEEILRKYPGALPETNGEALGWIWQPFDEPTWSKLPRIVSFIISAMERAGREGMPPAPLEIDARLGISICLMHIQTDVNVAPLYEEVTSRESTKASLSVYSLGNAMAKTGVGNCRDELKASLQNIPIKDYEKRVKAMCEAVKATDYFRYLLKCLPHRVGARFLDRLIRGPRPTINDWIKMFHPPQYRFATGWHYRVILAIALLLSIISELHLVVRLFGSGTILSWNNWYLLVASALLPLYWIFMHWAFDIFMDSREFPLITVAGPILGLGVIYDLVDDGCAPIEVIAAVISACWLPIIVVAVSVTLLKVVASYYLIGIWIVLLGICIALWRRGVSLDREARNPLHDLIW
jgi:hypothetical protein